MDVPVAVSRDNPKAGGFWGCLFSIKLLVDRPCVLPILPPLLGDVAQVARAGVSYALGQWFNSTHRHFLSPEKVFRALSNCRAVDTA